MLTIISTKSKIKNKLRTIEAQIVQKLKNNEARPKFTGSYKRKRVLFCKPLKIVLQHA